MYQRILKLTQDYGTVRGIYQIGSRVYQCSEEDSDYDFIVVGIGKYELVLSDKEINVHLINAKQFEKNIEKHLPFYLLTKWLPKENILKKKNEVPFMINYHRIYDNFIAEKNLCINKSMRYFNSNLRTSLKNIIHAIRYTMFGIQIFENGSIYDFTCANDYYNEIFKLNYDTWEKYFDHYKNVFEKFEKVLTKLRDEFDDTIQKYNKKPEKGLITQQFLKDFTLKDLEKYFCIEVKKIDNYIILNATEESNRELKLVKECNKLILDPKTFDIIALGFQNIYDSTVESNIPDFTKKNYKLSRNPSLENPPILMFFDNNTKLWTQLVQQKLVPQFSETKYKSLDCSKCFMMSSFGELVGVIDRDTLEEESPSNYSEYMRVVQNVYITKTYEELMKSYTSKRIDEKYILIDEDYNRILIQHPIYKAVRINTEDAYLDLIRNAEHKSLKYKNFIHNHTLDGATLYIQLEEKFMKMHDNIYNSYENEELDPYYDEVYSVMSSTGFWKNLDQYFRSIDLNKLKDLMNHKRVRVKIDNIWKDIKLIEVLPTEMQALVFSFLDSKTLSIISYATSKYFSWIRSDESMIKEIFSYEYKIFQMDVLERIQPFNDTKQFQMYHRVVPYDTRDEYIFDITFKLHDHRYKLGARELNQFETSVFKLFPSDAIPTPKSIVSHDVFLKRLNENFCFDKWKDYLDWSCFQIVGGSVLKCLLNDSFEAENQDIDIFCKFDDMYQFDTYIQSFYRGMSKYEFSERYSNGYEDNVRTVEVVIDSKTLIFQFVVAEGIDYNNLDMDCCQVGFDGKHVLATQSFVESLNTGTFLNYHLLSDNEMTEKTKLRIEKYMKRGFSFLLPMKFDYENANVFVDGNGEDQFEYNEDPLEVLQETEKLLK